ncbi:MAG: nicotinamide-nucleotide amidohydrolase family protein, partial [Clostridiales bacterium]|nr:nicotinamide-nucleotide amidohydrolase family protein [Clostridiales bacterium]
RVSYELSKHGYFVTHVLEISDPAHIFDAFDFLRTRIDAVAVCGNTDAFYAAVASKYEIGRVLSTFLLNGTPCAVSKTCDADFLHDFLIPMLNSRCKTFYTANVFRTVGKSETELRALLKDYIKNRNKIVFKFIAKPPECTVLVRYSNKTQKSTVQEMLANVTTALKDCTYAYNDAELSETVARMLMDRHKTVGLAESFTGGNIAAELVRFAGISASFKESVVCYDSAVKQSRLHVSEEIIRNHGAVSVETAYEMAANLLAEGQYDYVVATTGNAGPTSEKPGQTGVCYIAVGDKDNIDIYPCRFEGDRAAVIHNGTVTALYYLYRILRNAATEKNDNQPKNV